MKRTNDKSGTQAEVLTAAWIEPKHPTGDSFLNALADLLLYLDQQDIPQPEPNTRKTQTMP